MTEQRFIAIGLTALVAGMSFFGGCVLVSCQSPKPGSLSMNAPTRFEPPRHRQQVRGPSPVQSTDSVRLERLRVDAFVDADVNTPPGLGRRLGDELRQRLHRFDVVLRPDAPTDRADDADIVFVARITSSPTDDRPQTWELTMTATTRLPGTPPATWQRGAAGANSVELAILVDRLVTEFEQHVLDMTSRATTSHGPTWQAR